MKKLLATVFCLCVLGVTAQAQEFQLGLKGGVNFASLSTDVSDFDFSSNTGFNAGAFVKLKFSKIAIQPEIMWSLQGASAESVDDILGTFENTFKYNYINIPILVKLYLVGGVNVFAGPQLGFLSSAELTTTINGVETTQELDGVLSGSDLSAVIGAGVDLPAGFHVDVRYNIGISNTVDDDDADTQRNQVFQIGLGWAFIKK